MALGNQYPAWIITSKAQISSVAADGTIKAQSPEDFAYDIGISDDGTLWVVSTTADPDGGGAKIFWGNGDGNWNEIKTPNPGATAITGTGPGFCFYTTSGGDFWQLQTNGNAKKEPFVSGVVDADYGMGGMLWAVFPDKPGLQPTLHFGKFGTSPFNWTLFPGNVSPTSISANSNNYCYGLINGAAFQYSTGGKIMPLSQGAKRGMYISFKQGSVPSQDRCYMTTANGNQNGNQVLIWQTDHWADAGFRAIKTLATYYRH